jgi:hypothetical protein
MKTKHIVINKDEIPKNIRYRVTKCLLDTDTLRSLTIKQAEEILDIIEKVSEIVIEEQCSGEY